MHWWILLILLTTTLVVGLLSLRYGILLGHRFSLLDLPGKHKRHNRPVPIIGGAALLITIWSGILLMYLLPIQLSQEFWHVVPYILAGALVIFLVGLSDDIKPLSPWLKLLAECAAGLILFMGGMTVDPISIPFAGSIELGWPSVFITLFWVVGLTNAINLIDGLDGLAGGEVYL